MQPLSPFAAFFAGAFGFGYLYVGRIGRALAYVAGAVGLIALGGWTRWILQPWFLYAAVGIAVSLYLLQVIRPILIAVRNPNEPRKRYNRWWFYIGWIVLASLGSEALIDYRAEVFGYETFRIPSVSMAPTLQPGDFIVVDSWRYAKQHPGFGDVVVYEDTTTSNTKLVKRIAGVPGDQIEIRGGALFRNGERVLEPYLLDSEQTAAGNWPVMTLATGQYYLLGDKRSNSRDSRFHGPVDEARILGPVACIYFSTASWKRFPVRLDSTGT
jgi:signal peptidase I